MFRLLPICILFVAGCTRFIFFPMQHLVITPADIGLDYEDVYIETVDSLSLHGWKLYAKSKSRGTLLFFYGNAQNISTHIANVYWLTEYGYDVYLFDYRGYGWSEGEPVLDMVVDDMERIIAYVSSSLDAGQLCVIIGQSLGGSLSIYAVAHSAWRDHITALISVSAFSDYHEIAQEALSQSWLFWLFQWPLSRTINNDYSPLVAIEHVSPLPLVIMHSHEDEIIGYHHAEELYKAAREPKQLKTMKGGHNNAFHLLSNRQLLLDTLFSLQKQ